MLRRQKHVLSQSTPPFACTLYKRQHGPWLKGPVLMVIHLLMPPPNHEDYHQHWGVDAFDGLSKAGMFRHQKRLQQSQDNSDVPEAHHPQRATLREALRGDLLFLRGLCGALLEGSALSGLCGVLPGVRGCFQGCCQRRTDLLLPIEFGEFSSHIGGDFFF